MDYHAYKIYSAYINMPNNYKWIKMRLCKKCAQELSVEEFYTHWHTCKKCVSIKRNIAYASDPSIREAKRRLAKMMNRRKRLLVWDYLLSHPCVDCGESDPMTLEFDHRNQIEKVTEISAIIHGGSIRLMWDEIAKCDVRCANCHRKRTWTQLNWEIPYIDYTWKDVKDGYFKDCSYTQSRGGAE